jgi:uncharacterized protein (TIGR00725 family)
MDNQKLYIGVVGEGEYKEETYQTAYEVGLLIAERGAVLVCGGLSGVMEAACKGAKSKNGLTVGILPSGDRQWANAYVDVPIPTGMGEARNALVARCADALVAVGGSFGTLSEIALALKIGKPVVGIETWGLYKGQKEDGSIVPAESPQEAVAAVFRILEA